MWVRLNFSLNNGHKINYILIKSKFFLKTLTFNKPKDYKNKLFKLFL